MLREITDSLRGELLESLKTVVLNGARGGGLVPAQAPVRPHARADAGSIANISMQQNIL